MHNIMNYWCRTFVAISENINHHPSLNFPGHYDQSLHTFSTQSSSRFMTETTPTKKSRIVQLKDLGHTDHDAAEKENVNPSTVSCIYGRYGKTQKFYEKKHRSGRPHKLNDYDMRCDMPWILIRPAPSYLHSARYFPLTPILETLFFQFISH